jgi:predicted ATPase/transcriptional regulator with XRE-family HTH domain/tetratricopeptide (TPR) repeat protein
MDERASFGYWVRRRRKALDLTQEALAQRVGCSVMTIRKIEGDERRPSRQIAERLADSLQVAPAERDRFINAARAARYVEALPASTELPAPPGPPSAHDPADAAPMVEAPAPQPWSALRHNLPAQMTPLIGRARLVAEVVALLGRPDVRLVTLTGPGGIGKTRLALQAAAELLPEIDDGVWLVELAPVGDPALVLPTIAEVLGLRDAGDRPLAQVLRDALRDQQTLLILDNLEHLLPSVPEVASLLSGAPGLKVLATSRERLRLTGEQVVVVPPLGLPPARKPVSGAELSNYPAAQLFLERARAVRPEFVLSDENAPAVAEICVRLDGLPLALELAAAWVRLFSSAALLQRLERRLPLLTGGPRDQTARQQTLRSTVAWSYALLTSEEQVVFRRLGVFVGGCTIAAAEAVAGAETTAAVLGALLDKSLLRQTDGADGEPRLLMLETVREYALEQLDASGETELAADRHAAFVQGWLEVAARELRGAREAVWFKLIQAEHDNVRAVFSRLVTRADHEGLAHIGAALWHFWWLGGHWREGRAWMEQIRERLNAVSAQAVDPQLRASIATGLSWMLAGASAFREALPFAEEGLADAQALGDALGQAHAWNALAHVRYGLSDLPGAETALAAARHSYEVAGRQADVAEMVVLQGFAHYIRGDVAGAQQRVEQGVELARTVRSITSEATGLLILGEIHIGKGEYAAAAERLEVGMGLSQLLANRHDVSSALNYLGELAYQQGDYGLAAERWSASLDLRRRLGDRRGAVVNLVSLGRTACGSGDLRQAIAWNVRGLEQAHELDYHQGYHWCLLLAGWIATELGKAEQAAWMLGAAERLAQDSSLHIWPELQREHDDAVAAAQRELDAAAFAAAWAAGRAARLDDVLAAVRQQGAAEHLG